MRRAAVLLFGLSPLVSAAFGGEDPAFGKPWHHEVITKEAAGALGWTGGAYQELAWHADWVDGYLYNPVFWAQGGLDRLKASMIAKDELVKLHFDDLRTTASVQAAFEQMAGGTLVGLQWAAENDDLRAARCIAGISTHAMQDFFAHSNWIDDPARRGSTWLNTRPLTRLEHALYTGTYETPDRTGVKAHGKYSLSASLYNQPAVRAIMTPACHPASPMGNSAPCQAFRGAKGGVSLEIEIGRKWPEGIVYLNPAGIALDNGWLAEVAVRERGLLNHPDPATRMTAEQAFAEARAQAIQQSKEWLILMERAMLKMGHGEFWQRVKTDGSGRGSKHSQYENIGQLAYQFVSAGEYPKSRFGVRETFLRVSLKTSNKRLSGTDADIYAEVDGRRFPLDYIPDKNVVFRYNDFEQGSNDTYLLGPFTRLPSSITLKNDSASAGDVMKALARKFGESMKRSIDGVKKVWSAISGKEADFVAENRKVWTADELAQITGPTPFTIELDGDKEGHHRVHGEIRPGRSAADEGGSGDGHTFFVRLTELECIKESAWDRGSRQDEIFLVALGVPIGGEVQSARTPVFNNVNDGSRKRITNIGFNLTVNRAHGIIALPVAAWESDSEGNAARDRILREFETGTKEGTKDDSRGFLEEIARAVAADWRLENIRVYAFAKGPNLAAGEVLDQKVDGWIKGGGQRTFEIPSGKMKTLGAQIIDVAYLEKPALPRLILPPGRRIPPPSLVAEAIRSEKGLNLSKPEAAPPPGGCLHSH
jgi:hypothetical protein